MPLSSTFVTLSRCYAQTHRRYHTLAHIAQMLMHGLALGLNDVQVAGIWFHDAVYDPLARDNEEQSSKLAGAMLGAEGWNASDIASVQSIVLDTRKHVPSSPEARLVIDLDLAILAANWPEYLNYAAAIRAEYAAVPDETWLAGRIAFLQGVLARPVIFHTPWGKSLEPLARANLQRDLKSLQETRSHQA